MWGCNTAFKNYSHNLLESVHKANLKEEVEEEEFFAKNKISKSGETESKSSAELRGNCNLW